MYNRTLLIGRIGHNAEAKTDRNQQGVRCPEHRHQGQLEERPGRVRKPHRAAPRLRLAQSFAHCQDSPEEPAHHRRWPDS